MGKSLAKIVSSIRTPVLAHAPTDDARLEPEFIEDMILDVRASLVTDYFNGRHYLDDAFFQVHDGVEIFSQKVQIAAGIQDDHPEIYCKIPELQSHVGFKNIRYFGSIDGRHNFERKSISGFMSADGRLFTMNDPVYMVNGNKVTLKNLPSLGMRYGRLIAVFYDPREVYGFDRTADFPVPDSMIHRLEIACKKDLMSTLGIPPDVFNDAQDLTIQTSKERSNG